MRLALDLARAFAPPSIFTVMMKIKSHRACLSTRAAPSMVDAQRMLSANSLAQQNTGAHATKDFRATERLVLTLVSALSRMAGVMPLPTAPNAATA
jgi:hypothetical protein